MLTCEPRTRKHRRYSGAAEDASCTNPPAEASSVGLVKGNDRRQNIFQSLRLIEDQVFAAIGDKQILIKPNFVQTNKQLAATHAEAILGILDFLIVSSRTVPR